MNEEKRTKQILIPNKNPNRSFGIDFFASLYDGSYPYYKYFASLMDFEQVFSSDSLSSKPGGLEVFVNEISKLNPGMIVAFYQNPDPYNVLEEKEQQMIKALNAVKEHKLGVFIETSSVLLERDFDILKEIHKQAPVVIAIPFTHQNDPLTHTFEGNDATKVTERLKLVNKAKQAGFIVGALLKPIIPYINDSEETWVPLIDSLSKYSVDFIYPNFVLSVSENQRQNFFELVNHSFPGLKNIYMDKYGIKKTWSSPNAGVLKKEIVFACKKYKIKFGMKEIVEEISPKVVEQFKLF